MTQDVTQWLDLAEKDHGVAKHLLLTYYPTPYEIVCYHCQQAAEKAIKAVIIAYGAKGGLPKLHDLAFLLKQLKHQIHIDKKYYEYADTLTPYGTSIRYPNELFLGEEHAKTALRMAKEFLQWAHEQVALAPEQDEQL